MKPGYSSLISLVKTATELPMCNLYTLSFLNGTVLRVTDLDVPVWSGGNYFAANTIRIDNLKFKQTVGVDIDQQEIDLIYSSTDTINGISVPLALRSHVFDKCGVKLERAFFDPASAWPPDPVNGAQATGSVVLFVGRVADVTQVGRTTATINVKSDLVLLDIDFPRNIWQASCLHTLYDAGCTVNKGAYQGFGACGAGSTARVIVYGSGGAGASLTAVMSGPEGASINRVVLTSAAAVNAGYASAPSVTVTDPTGSGAVLVPVMSPRPLASGLYQLAGILVKNGGSGYTNPTVTISAGSAGTATASAVLNAGAQSVASVIVNNGGSGFSPATAIAFSGGGGNGAQLVPVISGGVIQSVDVINGGGLFYAAPSLTANDAPAVNYSQGTILFQGGQNSGVLAQIALATSSELVLVNPLETVPAVGDVFTIWPGCDHSTGAGGCEKFNNLANFRGYPFVPPPETAY